MNRASPAEAGRLSIRQFRREGTLWWPQQAQSFSVQKHFQVEARSHFASAAEAGSRQRDWSVPAHAARPSALAYQKRTRPMRTPARGLRQRLAGWTISLNLKSAFLPAAGKQVRKPFFR